MGLKKGNAGNFMCPPQHPNHNYEYSTSNEFCSMDYIQENPKHYPEDVVKRVRKMFDHYEETKPSLDSQEVKDWIYYVHGYFHHCFAEDHEKPLHVSDNCKVMKRPRSERKLEDLYATLYIRKYYPEYFPCISDLKNARYGVGKVKMYKPKRKSKKNYAE